MKESYFDVWHRLCAEAGRTDLRMAHNEFVYVGESDAEVKAEVEERVMWYVRTAAKIWGERDRSKVAKQYANYNDILEWLEVVPFEEIYDSLGMFGTPDSVAEKVRWMRDEGGVQQLINFMSVGGLSQEKVLRNMRLFAEEVMPRFRDAERPVAAAE